MQAEVIEVSLAYQYRVRPLELASTGPMLVLIFIRVAVPASSSRSCRIELDLRWAWPDDVLDLADMDELADTG